MNARIQKKSNSELQCDIPMQPGVVFDTAQINFRERLVREIIGGLSGGRKVLDIGCADGTILAPLVHMHEIHGVDISPKAISIAAERGFHSKVHDIESGPLPYEAKSFDVVFSGETIEHQIDTDWFLAEINRVLVPNGLFVLTFPNIRTLTSLGMMLFLDLPPKFSSRYRAPHYRDFTLKMIKLALNNHGFTARRAVGCHFSFGNHAPIMSGLAKWFPSWSDVVVVVANKIADSVYDSETVIQPFLLGKPFVKSGCGEISGLNGNKLAVTGR